MKKHTRSIAFCSILAALATVFIMLGLLFPTFDLVAATIASFAVILTVCELSRKHAFSVFAVSSALSLILSPHNNAALVYACFLGYYPIIKSLIETKIKKRYIAILLKLITFNIAFAVILFIAIKFLSLERFIGWYAVAFVAIAEAAFIVYDILLTRMIIAYFRILRPRLRLSRFFKR